MKRTVMFAAAALLSGFVLGTLFGSGALTSGESAVLTAAAAGVGTPIPMAGSPDNPPAATVTPLNPEDDTLLLERAGQVLEAMKAADYGALAALVSPASGVTFTPYSTVNAEVDLCLTARQVAELGTDDTIYVWGLEDGTGEPIRLTGEERYGPGLCLLGAVLCALAGHSAVPCRRRGQSPHSDLLPYEPQTYGTRAPAP